MSSPLLLLCVCFYLCVSVCSATTGSFALYDSTGCGGTPLFSAVNVTAQTTEIFGESTPVPNCIAVSDVSGAAYASLFCGSFSDVNNGVYTGAVAYFTASPCTEEVEVAGTESATTTPNGGCVSGIQHLSNVHAMTITCDQSSGGSPASTGAGTNGASSAFSEQLGVWSCWRSLVVVLSMLGLLV